MIISMDPGINTTGLAVIQKDGKSLHIVETYFVNNSKAFSKVQKAMEKKQDSRYVRALAIIDKVEEYFNLYEIKGIVSEAAFYNPRRPIAYSSLLEVIFAIKYGLIRHIKVPFREIAPRLVKKIFAENGNAKKELMKERLELLVKDKLITLDKAIKIDELTEHEIDAIAVGWSFYEEYGDLL